MMKKHFLAVATLLSAIYFAQDYTGKVGINTTQPLATLDLQISSANTTTNEGLLIPRISRARVAAMPSPATSTLVYVNSVSDGSASGTTVNVDAVGFYFFNGTAWTKMGAGSASASAYKPEFYAPAIVLPTNPANVSTNATDDISYSSTTGAYTVKLYGIFQKQFGMTGDVSGSTRTAVRSNTSSTLSTYTASELDYFVTYFDNTVFDPANITLDTNGVLTYKVLSGSTVTEKTFMNIVFKVK